MFTLWVGLSPLALTEVSSLSGKINFDVLEDGVSEMTLNSTGLGVGISPQSNLHIAGNAIIQQQLSVGSSLSSSNLYISGTQSQSIESLSSSGNLYHHSLYLINPASANLQLQLPYAGNVTGRIVDLKAVNNSNTIWISAANSLIDNSAEWTLSSNSRLPHLQVISHLDNWHILSSQGANSGVASDNLVGHWALDETSGTTLYDSGPNAHHATVENFTLSSCTISTPMGHGIQFDGVNDRLVASFSDNLSQLSLSCWFQQNADSWDWLVNLRHTASGCTNQLYLGPKNTVSDHRMGTTLLDDARQFTPNEFAPNTKYHVVLTWSDLGISKLYKNGSEINSRSNYSSGNTMIFDTLYIGGGDHADRYLTES